MALNALRTEMVTFTGTPGIEVNGVIVGYRPEYTPRTSTEAKYNAIEGRTSDVASDFNHKGQYYIQLGEQLYNGDLRLNNNAEDPFGRPSRRWEYDGKEIGTYAKEELIRKSWTTEVTGKALYDLLGAATIRDYTTDIFIDGVDTKASNAQTILGSSTYFTTADMNRNNNKGVGSTGNGVLTQVFVDDDKDVVTIAIINTYLAFADEDYDTRTEEVDITVYGIDSVSKEYVKTLTANANDYSGFTLPVEDFPTIVDTKDGDAFLVTVAEGDVQTIAEPELLAAATISAFKVGSNVTVDGTKYDYSSAAEYDWEVLDFYTGTNAGNVNLKDLQYNVYLDKYGYAIGVDIVEAVNNYVFISAIQRSGSHLVNMTADANAIFLDGTAETIKINVAKSVLPNTQPGTDSILNSWCTYTENNGVYTIKEVSRVTSDPALGPVTKDPTKVPNGTANGTKIAQAWTSPSEVKDIDRNHLSLTGGGNSSVGYNKVYGNDNTVYLVAKLDELDHDSDGDNNSYGAISGVSSVITGIRNADLEVWSLADAQKDASDPNRRGEIPVDTAHQSHGVYALYGRDGYVIAAVVVGDDGASTNNLVYVHSSAVSWEQYNGKTSNRAAGDDLWTWVREVTLNGEKTELTEVGDSLTYLSNMQQYHWYQVRYNSNGEVIGIADSPTLATSAPFTPVPDWTLKRATGNTKATVGDYVTNIQWLEECLDEYDKVVYEESFTNDHPTMDVKKGNTLYVTTKNTEGIWVNDNVNILLMQYEKHKLVTTFTSGVSTLDKIVRDLNTTNGTSWDYDINAIVDGTGATAIIIYDRTDTYQVGPDPISPIDDYAPEAKINGYFIDVKAHTTNGSSTVVYAAALEALEANGWTLYGFAEKNNGTDTSAGTADDFWSLTARNGDTIRTFQTRLEQMVKINVNGRANWYSAGNAEWSFAADTIPNSNYYYQSNTKIDTITTDIRSNTGDVTVATSMDNKFLKTDLYSFYLAGSGWRSYWIGEDVPMSGSYYTADSAVDTAGKSSDATKFVATKNLKMSESMNNVTLYDNFWRVEDKTPSTPVVEFVKNGQATSNLTGSGITVDTFTKLADGSFVLVETGPVVTVTKDMTIEGGSYLKLDGFTYADTGLAKKLAADNLQLNASVRSGGVVVDGDRYVKQGDTVVFDLTLTSLTSSAQATNKVTLAVSSTNSDFTLTSATANSKDMTSAQQIITAGEKALDENMNSITVVLGAIGGTHTSGLTTLTLTLDDDQP